MPFPLFEENLVRHLIYLTFEMLSEVPAFWLVDIFIDQACFSRKHFAACEFLFPRILKVRMIPPDEFWRGNVKTTDGVVCFLMFVFYPQNYDCAPRFAPPPEADPFPVSTHCFLRDPPQQPHLLSL